tara:strand:+ start:1021 stop:1851 length:831 start_codon:yes stop_codon:yes gene_type:complete
MFNKILKFIKHILQMIAVVAIGFGISLGIHISVSESQKFPAYNEIRSLNNVSQELNHKEEKAVLSSRRSILHVLSSSPKRGGPAKMSGTYVEHNGKYYVITAAHGIVGECDRMFVATDRDNIYDCIKYIIIDYGVDYAIIQIEQVAGRTPVKLNNIKPSNREWRKEASVLNRVYYTGYPNGIGPLTFDGSIAGISSSNYLYLHSYAWPGSSGSGVFSHDGNMIGIVIALSVGFTAAGYDVLEDLVIVTPLFMIDWDTAYQIMAEPSPSGDTGDTGE